jgi:hypothetical protein
VGDHGNEPKLTMSSVGILPPPEGELGPKWLVAFLLTGALRYRKTLIIGSQVRGEKKVPKFKILIKDYW